MYDLNHDPEKAFEAQRAELIKLNNLRAKSLIRVHNSKQFSSKVKTNSIVLDCGVPKSKDKHIDSQDIKSNQGLYSYFVT